MRCSSLPLMSSPVILVTHEVNMNELKSFRIVQYGTFIPTGGISRNPYEPEGEEKILNEFFDPLRDEDRHVRRDLVVTYKDTETGEEKTVKEENMARYDYEDGNWACDCNRVDSFTGKHSEGNTCIEGGRYEIIKLTAGENINNGVKE